MTKKFNVFTTCPRCGTRMTAETSFCRWMRREPRLDSGTGIVRTDCDHIVCRYKTSTDGREFQLLMIVEVKEYGAEPDPAQRDLLSFISQILFHRGTNRYGAVTTMTSRLKSHILGRKVDVRCFGAFLLQFEKTNPDDSAWIKWNRRIVDKQTLVEILSMDRRPDNPALRMIDYLRDRHRKTKQEMLLNFDLNLQSVSLP